MQPLCPEPSLSCPSKLTLDLCGWMCLRCRVVVCGTGHHWLCQTFLCRSLWRCWERRGLRAAGAELLAWQRRRQGRSREPGLRGTAMLGRRSGAMRRCRGAGLAALAAVLLVVVARAQVQQERSLETTEGTGVNISCSHPKIQTNEFIYWYRQLPGRGPELLASTAGGTKELPAIAGQLWVSADRHSSALWLGQPRRRDAAVYYCALVARAEEPGLRPGTNRGGRGPQGPGAQRRPRPAGGAAAPPAGPQAAPQLLQCPEPAHSDSAQPATAPTHGCQPACWKNKEK
ncbi:uncharacterized protein LOC117006301 [Catharus ustulatus]|uniref:uncharacterized protein LOC117006301 n=1 Tax=Catharus ustulatus TaxID=91951 RepID=UPI00140D1920|nr:uncharacterized protein LOC117006301 [Catharus ustulatus]